MLKTEFIPQFLNNFPEHEKLSYLKREGILYVRYAGYILFKLKSIDDGTEIEFDNSNDLENEVLKQNILTFPSGNPDKSKQDLIFNIMSDLMGIIDVLTPVYPRIYVKTSRTRPIFIVGAGLVGIDSLKYIKVNYSIRRNCLGPTSTVCKELMIKHYVDHNGKVNFFGEIVGYTYYQSNDHGYDYDIEGNLIGVTSVPDPLEWVHIQVL